MGGASGLGGYWGRWWPVRAGGYCGGKEGERRCACCCCLGSGECRRLCNKWMGRSTVCPCRRPAPPLQQPSLHRVPPVRRAYPTALGSWEALGSGGGRAAGAAAAAVAGSGYMPALGFRPAPEERCPGVLSSGVDLVGWARATGIQRIVMSGDSTIRQLFQRAITLSRGQPVTVGGRAGGCSGSSWGAAGGLALGLCIDSLGSAAGRQIVPYTELCKPRLPPCPPTHLVPRLPQMDATGQRFAHYEICQQVGPRGGRHRSVLGWAGLGRLGRAGPGGG